MSSQVASNETVEEDEVSVVPNSKTTAAVQVPKLPTVEVQAVVASVSEPVHPAPVSNRVVGELSSPSSASSINAGNAQSNSSVAVEENLEPKPVGKPKDTVTTPPPSTQTTSQTTPASTMDGSNYSPSVASTVTTNTGATKPSSASIVVAPRAPTVATTINLQDYNGKSPLDDPNKVRNLSLHEEMQQICLYAGTFAERPSRQRAPVTRFTVPPNNDANGTKPPRRGSHITLDTSPAAPVVTAVPKTRVNKPVRRHDTKIPVHNLLSAMCDEPDATSNARMSPPPPVVPVASRTLPAKVAAVATRPPMRDLVCCGTCERCRVDNCTKCRGCLLHLATEPANSTTQHWCVLKCCESNPEKVSKWFEKELDRMLAIKEDLHKGDGVYCYWEESQLYFEGVVARVRADGERAYERVYDIHFTDGDRRTRVPPHDILTLYEMELQVELNRLEEARGYNAQDSMSSPPPKKNRGGRHRKDETKRLKETQPLKPPEDAKPLEGTEKPEPTAEKPKRRGSIPEMCTSSSIESVPPKKPRRMSLPKPKVDDSEKTQQSKEKNINSRCYARWSNKQYYWGKIMEIITKDKHISYTVLFDDGDVLTAIPARFVFSKFEHDELNGIAKDKDGNDRMDDDETETTNHELYGEGFCLKWRDINGLVRTSFGRIRERVRPDGSNELFYTVEYINNVPNILGSENPEPTKVVVKEKVAWGGYMAYVDEIGIPSQKDFVPFYLKWLLPDVRRTGSDGCLIMEVRGFRLLFEVKRSSITCTLSVGLGLVVTVTDLTGEQRPNFVLEAGELLGLGMYAPMCESDRKPKHIFEVKSFIHDYKPLAYVYDADRRDGVVFDVTDDKTGMLHDKASQNSLVRVNETDGVEYPSVVSDFDAIGGVQFYLGRGEKQFGELLIPVNEQFELKIDYGERNERNRVLQDYPRVRGKELKQLQSSAANADEEALDDFAHFNASQVHECLIFLDSLFHPYWEAPIHKLQRCFIVALVLQSRVTALIKEADTQTLISTRELNTVNIAKTMMATICKQWSDAEQLKAAVVSCSMLKREVMKCLKITQKLESYDASKLRQKLQDL